MTEPQHVERETRPRHGDICDWGASRRVLARTRDENTLLFVVGSHTMSAGARGYGRQYCRSSLVLFQRSTPPHGNADWTTLHEGRISHEVLVRHAGRIDAAFGRPITRSIDPLRTLVV